jgi:hypothetical protein
MDRSMASPMQLTEETGHFVGQGDPETKDKGFFLLWLLVNMVLISSYRPANGGNWLTTEVEPTSWT